MNTETKSDIYGMIDTIQDENVLQMIMHEASFYAGIKKAIDDMTIEQLKELDNVLFHREDK